MADTKLMDDPNRQAVGLEPIRSEANDATPPEKKSGEKKTEAKEEA